MLRQIMCLLVLIALVSNGCSPIPPPHPGLVPARILFIGTSDTYYNEGVDKHLQGMAASDIPPLQAQVASETMGGTPLSGLWARESLREKIKEGNWDVVVIEGEFAMGGRDDEQNYREHVRKFDELIRGIGARPVLFMNWQFNHAPDLPAIGYYPQIEEIAQVASRAGAQIKAEVAPVGLAFDRALAEEPDLELYDPDRIHSNAQDTYLTTAVFYATIFDRSPEGLPYGLEDALQEHEAYDKFRAQYTVPEEEKSFLQRIAWQTVQEYQAQQGISQ